MFLSLDMGHDTDRDQILITTHTNSITEDFPSNPFQWSCQVVVNQNPFKFKHRCCDGLLSRWGWDLKEKCVVSACQSGAYVLTLSVSYIRIMWDIYWWIEVQLTQEFLQFRIDFMISLWDRDFVNLLFYLPKHIFHILNIKTSITIFHDINGYPYEETKLKIKLTQVAPNSNVCHC